jgi:UDP-glucose 4-epimerase
MSSASSAGRCRILVTGGCGYIGSHTIVCLLQQLVDDQSSMEYDVVVVDNLINSSSISLDRVSEICQLTPGVRAQRLKFYTVDICHESDLRKVFEDEKAACHGGAPFAACIHFAGLKVSLLC